MSFISNKQTYDSLHLNCFLSQQIGDLLIQYLNSSFLDQEALFKSH